jgi:OmpA-OmpF porin, OOP family
MRKAKFRLIYLAIALFPVTGVLGQGKSNPNHVNLGKSINSPYDETNLVLSRDGNLLYFTVVKHPENSAGRKDKGDIWFTEKDTEGNWKPSRRITGPVNNKHKNTVVAVLDNGNTLLLHGHYEQDESTPKTYGLSISRKNSYGEWGFPEKANFEYFPNKSEDLSASVSEDGNVMILSLDSYGSYGAEDLYVSFIRNGRWSEPQNLGSKINTSFQELSPYLSSDGKTLYFASNGRKGLGSKDIYVTVRQDDTWKKWSEPLNLGEKVNTGGSETFFIHPMGKEEAFIISTQNSDGYGDINKIVIKKEEQFWEDPDFVPAEVVKKEELIIAAPVVKVEVQVEKAEPVVIKEEVAPQKINISVFVKNAKTAEPVSAELQLISNINSEIVKRTTNTQGMGKFEIDRNDGDFSMKIIAKGFFEVEERVHVTSSTNDFTRDVNMTPLEVGTTIQLKNILFERGTANLLEDSFPDLEKVTKMMIENPNMEIELTGHTDNTGISKLNIKLSQDRVEAVKQILVEKGVEAKKITGKGYGGTRPIASNKSEDTRKLNRRVEFTILKME